MAEAEAQKWDIEDRDEDSMENRYLLFQVVSEEYGIGIEHIIEIVGLQKITNVPEMPDYVKGVINLRGQVIPVVDVRIRFGIEAKEYDDRSCVVVVKLDEIHVGLIVDEVSEVQIIPTEMISPPPTVQKSAGSRFIRGMGRVGEEVKVLLDVTKLLETADLAAVMTKKGSGDQVLA